MASAQTYFCQGTWRQPATPVMLLISHHLWLPSLPSEKLLGSRVLSNLQLTYFNEQAKDHSIASLPPSKARPIIILSSSYLCILHLSDPRKLLGCLEMLLMKNQMLAAGMPRDSAEGCVGNKWALRGLQVQWDLEFPRLEEPVWFFLSSLVKISWLYCLCLVSIHGFICSVFWIIFTVLLSVALKIIFTLLCKEMSHHAE